VVSLFAIGRKQPSVLLNFQRFERLLLVKADTQSQALENSMSNRQLAAQNLPLG